jgi:hypothetical protein
MIKQLAAALAAFTLTAVGFSAPIAAQAQDVPSYAQPAPSGEGQIRGRITSFDGAFSVIVRDERGYNDNVQLHPGTIINPTGITLAPGMVVSILGYNAGSYFSANEVDTPYTYYSGIPYYSGHPWDYYGPSVSLAFFFGNPGWWHGSYFYGPHHYYGGVRVYDSVHVTNVYRSYGGSFQGRSYVAPPERGGYYAHRAPLTQNEGRHPNTQQGEGRHGPPTARGHEDRGHGDR